MPTLSDRCVAARYDALFVDLDGVVYRGDQQVPHAAEALDQVRRLGLRLLFLTNNSSKTVRQVVGKLAGMGLRADPAEVLTSGHAAAAMLVREGMTGRTAFVIGERGLREALADAGIEILDGDPERADLVVVGWDRHVDYTKLRTAGLLIQRGARLVATNTDATYPVPDGLWPGAGAIVAAVVTTTGVEPTVVGKPNPPLFRAAAEATGAKRPLVVGDRLDTDIAGARAMEWDSLLVLTGAAGPADLLGTSSFPTFVGADLRLLLEDVPRGEFRPARAGDVPGLRALLDASGLISRGIEERLPSTWVCRPGDAADIEATVCLDGVGEFRILRSVAVSEANRGKGLGLLAVAHAVGEAAGRGIARVFLFTESAPRFFERLGFRALARTDLPEAVRTSSHALEECGESATPMVLDLARAN